MSLVFRKIGITARSDIAGQTDCIDQIIRLLQAQGADVYLDTQRCPTNRHRNCYSMEQNTNLDLMIVIGGDGTILRTVRELPSLKIPMVSINKGRVGFLTSMTTEEAGTLLPAMLSGEDGVIEQRSLIDVTVLRKESVVFVGRALNEAVVSQGAIARLIDVETKINGKALTTFHVDGVIIATPTGSTAYSLAAGGPIVHPELPAIILTPINPHSFSQKPIVLPANALIDIGIVPKRKQLNDIQVSLTLDGQTYITLESHDIVRVASSRDVVRFLHRRNGTFFETLRKKLKWGERREEEQQ